MTLEPLTLTKFKMLISHGRRTVQKPPNRHRSNLNFGTVPADTRMPLKDKVLDYTTTFDSLNNWLYDFVEAWYAWG